VAQQTADDDRILLDRCVAGDRDAWARLITGKSRLVYYALRQTFRAKGVEPEESELEELHNEVFSRLFADDCRKLRTFEGRNGCSLASWIRLIATRTALTHIGRRGRLVLAGDGGDEEESDPMERVADEAPGAEEVVVREGEVARLRAAVAALNSDDRLFVTLYFLREMSLSEVADVMQVTVNTVYSRKNRVLNRLRAAMAAG
jgi:RNA polymerase sigma-70 factor (ECF subfamily)